MPEFPDVTVYIEALSERVLNQPIQKIRIGSPFVLRSFDPAIGAAEGKKVLALRRLGKRIVFELDDELFLIIHLMIAGRFHWKPKGAKIARKYGQAAFDFPNGTLLLTEAGTKKRASIYLVRGRAALQEHDPGGLEVFDASLEQFREALTRENHTLKRSLTDPHLFSGIGNAYSDEILHRARLSPIRLTQQMTAVEIETLYHAIRESLNDWVERLRKERGSELPGKSHRLPPRHGRPRQIPKAVSGLRLSRPAYRPRRERNQLLRALPDRWKVTGRPIAVAASKRGLAADLGRVRGRTKGANGVKLDGLFCVENGLPFLWQAGGDG